MEVLREVLGSTRGSTGVVLEKYWGKYLGSTEVLGSTRGCIREVQGEVRKY